jgi:osmoprotectant transport system permease protein
VRPRLAAVALLLAAAAPAPVAARALVVASKSFTESVILGEIVAQSERAAGVAAEHRAGLGGTRLVWDALVRGAVDVYPEYTGTIVREVLPELSRPELSSSASSDQLAHALAAHGVGMTAPLGFDNTYAIGLLRARARALDVARISDLRSHPALTFGFSNEFMSRGDGWPALQKRYGLPQQQGHVRGLDHDLAYKALAAGTIDATDIYTTDAEIRGLDLVTLEDDLGFFARYDAVLLYRLDVGARFGPQAVAALHRLEGRIDAATMIALNARAKLDHVPESAVAAGFLGTAAHDSTPRAQTARAVIERVVEHLELVAVSLLAAIFVAVPLGILAAKLPRFGGPVLAATGIVQTVPTLALFVFMIPLFGIGTVPAVVALFLYALLPIVRNTHAGLVGIPNPVRESAEALGLPPAAILRRVELPLASPLIFAGIESAAVINVGAATLGALIGAGGLGQPIFTGIRLDDLGLILAGAVPASLLALAVQTLFELLERLLVPRGLRAPRSR